MLNSQYVDFHIKHYKRIRKETINAVVIEGT